MPYPFHTIGRSTRSIAHFVALLRIGEIALVGDDGNRRANGVAELLRQAV